MKTFTAIDFETATPSRDSACAIGLVRVVNGVIIQKYYSLIMPPGNEYSIYNTNIHGINSTMTEYAPNFMFVFNQIKDLLHGQNVVAHNTLFDVDVLRKTMQKSGIDTESIEISIHDTMELFDGKKLKDCCIEHNINLEHHNALSDAEACARLFLLAHSHEIIQTKGSVQIVKEGNRHQKISGDVLKPNFDLAVSTDNFFYKKKVVITGLYNAWTREELRQTLVPSLQKLGADIDSGVGEKTNILICGREPGPMKIEKVRKLIEQGKDCVIINEDELLEKINGLVISTENDGEFLRQTRIFIKNGRYGEETFCKPINKK